MNTNLLHNILNVAIAFVGAMMAFDWTVLFSQSTAGAIIAVLSAVKLFVNAVRDGLAGMTQPQPPVGSSTP